MTMVSSRRPSGGQPSGAAAAYLMASAFAVDDDSHRGGGGGGISRTNTADDDESCIFPTTSSLVSSVAAGSSPKSLRSSGGGGGYVPPSPSSPRRRSYNGPYVYELRAPDSSFDSECSGSVASSFTAGPSASVAGTGSFGYRASNAGFAASAYPSTGFSVSPRRRNLGDHRTREIDDDVASDLVSDLTTISAPVHSIGASNGVSSKHKSKRGRGRGAIKSISRSFRSRSPGRRNSRKQQQSQSQHDGAVSVDGSLKTTRTSQSAPTLERRRSRTRSPLRKVAESISSGIKKTTKKGRRRSRSAGAESRLGAISSEDYAGRAAKLLTSSTFSVDPAEYDDDDDDGSVSIYSGSSTGSYSTAPCSVGASSVASAPVVLRSSRRRPSTGSVSVGMRRVVSHGSLLPSLIQEEVCEDGVLDTSMLGEDDPIASSVFAATLSPEMKIRDEARQETEDVVKSVERRTRKSLLQRAKSTRKNMRVGRSRSRNRNVRRRNKSCDDSDSVISDISAPGRIQVSVSTNKPNEVKIDATRPTKAPKVSRAPIPSGLSKRMSTEDIMAHLKAGSGAADAVRRLREHQSGLAVRSPSPCGQSKLKYTYIAGIPVPDYAAYVEGRVGALRRSMGVSDEDYAAAKDKLLSWAYYGSEI